MASGAAPSNGPSAPPHADSPGSNPLSWEGDKMFNVYIHDYCVKRGFLKTARELVAEADISQDSLPPINAKQGLLFEWWSVFWLLFGAKSSGTGSDDAIAYTQHQAQQLAQRQQMQNRMPPQLQMNRFMNGIQRQPPFVLNGQLPNGAGQASLPGGSGAMQPGAHNATSFPTSTSGPQPNGILGPPAAQGPSSQPPNFSQGPGQRQTGPPQRGPNGMPFQSPTLSHAPNAGAPGQQAPMGQLGPSPHIQMNRGVMLPPNGPQGMGNPGVTGAVPQGQIPFSQRSPSRTGSPNSGNMMPHPSPSLMARQAVAIDNEFKQIPLSLLPTLKSDAGLAEKDSSTLTHDDKYHIVQLFQRGTRAKQPNATAGPSSSSPLMLPNQGNPQARQPSQRLKRNSTSPSGEQATLPRTDNSPPDRKRPRRSPLNMEQQQQSQQPQSQQPMTPLTSYPQPPPPQGGPQQLPNGMMRGVAGPSINGFPPQGMPNMAGNPGMNVQMGQPVAPPQLANAVSPGMTQQGGMLNAQHMTPLQQIHMRERTVVQKGLPPGVQLPGGAGMPGASDPSFNAGGPPGQFTGAPGNRMSQNKMMPPPSPASGPSKDHVGSKDNKAGISNLPNGQPDGSPHNPPNMAPGQGGPNNVSQGAGNAPPTPGAGAALSMTAPSPSSLMANPPSNHMSQPPQPPPQPTSAVDAMQPSLFSNDFIQSVASSLGDEFDASLFRADGDLSFERDFGEWFTDDVTALDMK